MHRTWSTVSKEDGEAGITTDEDGLIRLDDWR